MTLGGGQKEDQQGKVGAVGAGSSKLDADQRIKDAIRNELGIVKEAETTHKPVDPETIAQVSRELPRLIQQTLQKIEANQVYQTFKLPGSNQVVHDRREGHPAEKGHEKEKEGRIREESKMSLEDLLVKKGKLGAAKEKEYENYLADPATRMKPVPKQNFIEEKLSKLLSRFENTLLKRFEEGASVMKNAEEGRFSFFKKTAEQWREFFGHFLQRTVKRHVPVDSVEGWVYRGLVQKNARATVISDLALRNGQIEKFARFRLSQAAQNLANRLNRMEPGAKLSGNDLREHTPEELEYLAIKNAEADTAWAQAPTQGKFLKTAHAEEKVAVALGFQKEKVSWEEKRHKKGGFFGLQEEAPADEPLLQFIPWYSSFVPRKGTGPIRWYVVVTYLVVAALLIFGLWSLISGL